MRQVFKYAVNVNTPPSEYIVPDGSKPLSVAVQQEQICAWVEQPVTWFERKRLRLIAVGTGWAEVPDEGVEFLGTVVLYDGTLVLHIYYSLEGVNEREEVQEASTLGSPVGNG